MHKVHKLGNAQTDTGYYTYYQNLLKNESAHSNISNAFWSMPGISHKEKETVIKYRSGTIYNQKHAVRFKQSNSLSCPICSSQDSALHILSGCQHPIIRNMVTERHNIAGRLITKAISKGSLGSCFVSTDVGSADKHRMQDLQIPVTAESRVPPALIFAINHNQRDRLTSRPDAILVTPKKTRNINSQNQQNHPNDQGLTLRSGRRVVLGGGQGPSAAATAAGGRPPTSATAYQPRQTRPQNLPWQRRTTHLIEIKYCEDTRPEQQLQAAHAQHSSLRRSIAGDHVLHVILLGVGGVIYIPHTLEPLKSLGLDSQRAKSLALKLHAHSVHYAHKLVQTRRSLEHSPHFQTNQERFAGLSARNPPDPH